MFWVVFFPLLLLLLVPVLAGLVAYREEGLMEFKGRGDGIG